MIKVKDFYCGTVEGQNMTLIVGRKYSDELMIQQCILISTYTRGSVILLTPNLIVNYN